MKRPTTPAMFLLVICAAAALAQSPTFVPGGDFEIWVDDQLDPGARIYESATEAAVLVVSDRLPTPVLLHVRSSGVQAVPKDRIEETTNGYVSLKRGDPLQELGKFEVVATDVTFRYGETSGVLRPRAPLVGAQTLDALYQHTPNYKVGAAAYEPDADTVAKLRGLSGEYRVLFVFGSWCSVCKQYLPRGLAVVEALAGALMQFEYLGLPLEDPWNTPEVKRLGVKSLPTAIVYRGDEEIGRFAGGEQFNQPEMRILEAIERAE